MISVYSHELFVLFVFFKTMRNTKEPMILWTVLDTAEYLVLLCCHLLLTHKKHEGKMRHQPFSSNLSLSTIADNYILDN